VRRNAIDIAPSTIFVRNENGYADVVGAEQMARDKAKNTPAGGMFLNPAWAEWSGTYPDYLQAATGAAPTKELTIVGGAKYGLRFNATVGVAHYHYTDYGSGIIDTAGVKQNYITIEFEVYLVSGGSSGLGMILDWAYSDGYRRANIPLSAYVVQTGRYYRFRYVLKHDDQAEFTGTNLAANYLGLRMYWMPNYYDGGGAAFNAKDVIWGRTQIALSTQQEIDAYNAIKPGGAGLKPITWERSGLDEPPTNFFKLNSNTLDQVVDGTTSKKVAATEVASGQIIQVRDAVDAVTLTPSQLRRQIMPFVSL
jgi:hypothetical protein